MKKLFLTVLFMLAGSHAAFAADLLDAASAPVVATSWDFAFGAKLMSDYNFRGISQSDRNPSVNVYGEFRYDLFYAGVAFYATDLPTDPVGEVDIYGGVRKTFDDVSVDLGALYYYYPSETQLFDGGAVTPSNTDFLEFYAKLAWNVSDTVNLGANLFYAADWLNTGSSGIYTSLTGKVTLIEDLSASAELGRYWLDTATNPGPPFALVDYTYWNAGLTYALNEAVSVDLRYHDTDLGEAQCFTNTTDPHGISTGSTPGLSDWCGSAFIATISIDLLASKLHK